MGEKFLKLAILSIGIFAITWMVSATFHAAKPPIDLNDAIRMREYFALHFECDELDFHGIYQLHIDDAPPQFGCRVVKIERNVAPWSVGNYMAEE